MDSAEIMARLAGEDRGELIETVASIIQYDHLQLAGRRALVPGVRDQLLIMRVAGVNNNQFMIDRRHPRLLEQFGRGKTCRINNCGRRKQPTRLQFFHGEPSLGDRQFEEVQPKFEQSEPSQLEAAYVPPQWFIGPAGFRADGP